MCNLRFAKRMFLLGVLFFTSIIQASTSVFTLQGVVQQIFTVAVSASSGGSLSGSVFSITSDLTTSGGTTSAVAVTTNGTAQYSLTFDSANGLELRKDGTSTTTNEFIGYGVTWNGATVTDGAKFAQATTGDISSTNILSFSTAGNTSLISGTYSDVVTITASLDSA